MTQFSKISATSFFAAAVALFAFAGVAQAQIIWDDPGSAHGSVSSQPRTQPVTTAAPVMGGEMVNGLHKNFEFTGNARLNKTDTRKLQQALKDRGFYKSTVDGIWGGQTTQAILDYQAVNMQPLTGTVNAGTLTDLGVYIDSTYYANR